MGKAKRVEKSGERTGEERGKNEGRTGEERGRNGEEMRKNRGSKWEGGVVHISSRTLKISSIFRRLHEWRRATRSCSWATFIENHDLLEHQEWRECIRESHFLTSISFKRQSMQDPVAGKTAPEKEPHFAK